MFDRLQQLGVDVVDAPTVVNAVRKTPPSTFVGLVDQGRIVESTAHGQRRVWICQGLSALNGQPWNFSNKKRQRPCRTISRYENAHLGDWLPSLLSMVQIQLGINYHRMDPTDAIGTSPTPHAGIQPDKTADEDDAESLPAVRRLTITRADIEQCGYSGTCPTCDSIEPNGLISNPLP